MLNFKKIIIFSFIVLFSQDSDSAMNLSGGIGSTTLDGQIFNQISLRPEIPIGKFGIGFDIYLNIDSEGNIHAGDWRFNDLQSGTRTLIDKIRYIRWGKPTDPLYARFGNLYDVNLGMGILVLGYTNALQYPSVRKLGFDFKGDFGTLGIEAITSDFKYKPGLTAARLTYKILPGLNMGLSIATDIDQSAGLTDRDADGYPDVFDHYPDDINKFDEAEEQKSEWEDFYVEYVIANGDTNSFDEWFQQLPLNHNSYSPVSSITNELTGYAFDLSYHLPIGVLIYAQAATLSAQHSDSTSLIGGYGYVPLGLKYNYGPVTIQAEYRVNSEHFLFNYWDRSYEINRITVNGENIKTKEDKIFNYGQMEGLFIQAQVRLGNLFELKSNYTDMKGEVRESVDKSFITSEVNKSFSSILTLKTDLIPKLNKAELFYQQTNIPNPFAFEFSETTVYGYNLEIKISDDMVLVYKSSTSFNPPAVEDIEAIQRRDIELSDNEGISTNSTPINTIQLETRFSF